MAAIKFIEPMLLLKTSALPEGPEWLYELKFDGYRAVAYKTEGQLYLRSRNDNDFALRYPAITKALKRLPEGAAIDGEIVALDETGKPSFNVLQNLGSAPVPIFFYAFDVMMFGGKSVMGLPFDRRRELLEKKVMAKLDEPIRYSAALDGSLTDLIAAVRAQGLEGLVAKRRNSEYQPGLRSGAWQKMRLNQGQEFVIGGYTVGTKNFDALIIGYYEEKKLMYASRTRNGFTPMLRERLFQKLKKLEIPDCPFVNLPQKSSGRWGQGLTAEKMKDCRWLKPVTVGQFEFVEWTPEGHLRHTHFVALRDDKKATDVHREN